MNWIRSRIYNHVDQSLFSFTHRSVVSFSVIITFGVSSSGCCFPRRSLIYRGSWSSLIAEFLEKPTGMLFDHRSWFFFLTQPILQCNNRLVLLNGLVEVGWCCFCVALEFSLHLVTVPAISWRVKRTSEKEEEDDWNLLRMIVCIRSSSILLHIFSGEVMQIERVCLW